MAKGIEAIVEYEYAAQEPDELTIKKGDVINKIEKQALRWWAGTLIRTGERGMFPSNYVKEVEPSSSEMDVPLRQVPGRRCKVLFSYQPANEDELELQVGDIIDILSEVEEGWWKGKLNANVGVFPSNFVEEVFDNAPETKETSVRKNSKSSVDSDSSRQSNSNSMSVLNNEAFSQSESDLPELPPKPVKELCRVMFPYDAVNSDELTLKEGDVITLISRNGQDEGWWRGELNGRVGVFPDNFVQVVTTDESSKPARPPAKTSTVTTNRAKDSITRPSAPQATAQRTSMEFPLKPEEKVSPPGLSKKPVLPPPTTKKPIRSPSGASLNKTLGVSQPEAKPCATTSENHQNSIGHAPKLPLTTLTFSMTKVSTSETAKPTVGVKLNTEETDGSCFSRNSGSFTLMTNHNTGETLGDVDLDCVGRSPILTHPTALRVRAPRRRPPTSAPAKEVEEKSPGLVNGNAEPHFPLNEKAVKAPWVEELMMNQAKRNSEQGRTRVIIGGVNSEPPLSLSPEPAKPEPMKMSPSSVTLRGQAVSSAARPQSMFGNRTFNLSPSSPETITVSSKQWTELNEKVQRLETKIDLQSEAFTKAVRELSSKLNEETERRIKMQAEMEKLANVVTQV